MTDAPAPQSEQLSVEDAHKVLDAILSENPRPVFAKRHMAGGDVALVARAEGGVEIITILPDNPDRESLGMMGMRGLFITALFKIVQERDLIAEAIALVNAEINAGAIKPHALDS